MEDHIDVRRMRKFGINREFLLEGDHEGVDIALPAKPARCGNERSLADSVPVMKDVDPECRRRVHGLHLGWAIRVSEDFVPVPTQEAPPDLGQQRFKQVPFKVPSVRRPSSFSLAADQGDPMTLRPLSLFRQYVFVCLHLRLLSRVHMVIQRPHLSAEP